MPTNTGSDEVTGATRRIDVQSMRDLIYPRPAKRIRLPLRLIFVAAVLSTSIGCATASKPVAVEVESVGQLSASYASIATAPIHHDAPPEFVGVVGSDDEDAPVTVGAPAEKMEAPEAVTKVAHGF